MCGISVVVRLNRGRPQTTNGTNGKKGLANGHAKDTSVLEKKLKRSLEQIAHRGPDAQGIWISEDHDIGLAHCRLSINDLSPDGDQPIHDPASQIHAVVNGEIYDHDRIRAELKRDFGYEFRGHSDSEVVVALYQAYGAPAFLEHLRGEFALVIYDERSGDVIAARDRFGIKPLFWTLVDEGEEQKLLIAAEAKAFLPLGWKPEWDIESVALGNWQHDDRTPFKGITKVLPGYWMKASLDGSLEHHEYWDADYADKTKIDERSVTEMIDGVRERLLDAIRLRLRADVPIGIYLSGGLDSSIIAGMVTHLVREQGEKMGNRDATNRIMCFCIAFDKESGFDESDIAARTAEHLGVQMLTKEMNEAELAKHFEGSVWHTEHHNFDLNFVGKFALSELPRDNGYKVVLTGEGADEHFAGYPLFPSDYLLEADPADPSSPLAQKDDLRRKLAVQAEKDLLTGYKYMRARMPDWSPGEQQTRANGTHTASCMLAWQPDLTLFSAWVARCFEGYDPRNTVTSAWSARARHHIKHTWHPLNAALYSWTKSILPNSILSCLGDRSEMAHSIEARPPFLDHVLADYANKLPPSVKMRYMANEKPKSSGAQAGKLLEPTCEGVNRIVEKWILREAGRSFITQELYERRKHPYTAPIKWPEDGPLHRLFKELLTRENVDELGFVSWDVTREALEAGFGENGDPSALRICLTIGAWVVMSKRFGVKRAEAADLKIDGLEG